MKKFFKKTEGFTLVELIVVIAILGILAGVGTVGYSGYIKKARIAGDEQIMSVANQAFVAACTEVGVKPADVTVTGCGVSENDTFELGEVDAGSSTFAMRAAESKGDKIEGAFVKYFKGNEDSKFKYFDAVEYIPGLGFVGFSSEDGGLAAALSGYRKDYTAAAAAYMANGTSYKGNEPALIGTVTQFSTAFSGFIAEGGRADKLLKDAAFAQFCKTNDIDTANPDQVGTAMVMYAAQELSDLNSGAINSALKNAYDPEEGEIDLMALSSKMHGTNGTAADLALDGAVMAAAVAGFANSEYANQDVKNAFANYASVTDKNTLGAFVNSVIAAGKDDAAGTDAFAAYLNSQSAKDMEAFTGGLGAVHHGTNYLFDLYGTSDFEVELVNVLQGKWTPAA